MNHMTLFERMRRFIVEGHYCQGDPLPPEPVLQKQFECSRASLREALKQLETLDLVQIRRGVGTFVGPLGVAPLLDALASSAIIRSRTNPEAFLDLLEVRIALDVGLAERVCGAYAGSETPELDVIVKEMMAAAERDEDITEHDKHFHQVMLSVLNNSFAEDLVANFWTVFQTIGLYERSHLKIGRLEIARSHRDLVQAARAGDVQRYVHAIHVHYRGSREQAQLLSRRGDRLSAADQ